VLSFCHNTVWFCKLGFAIDYNVLRFQLLGTFGIWPNLNLNEILDVSSQCFCEGSEFWNVDFTDFA